MERGVSRLFLLERNIYSSGPNASAATLGILLASERYDSARFPNKSLFAIINVNPTLCNEINSLLGIIGSISAALARESNTKFRLLFIGL